MTTRADRRNGNRLNRLCKTFPGRKRILVLEEMSVFVDGIADSMEEIVEQDEQAERIGSGEVEEKMRQLRLIREMGDMVWKLARDLEKIRRELRQEGRDGNKQVRVEQEGSRQETGLGD